MEPLLEDLGNVNLEGIGWVIVGGETGKGARPMDLLWAAGIRDQCKKIPFFFKRTGPRGEETLDGITWREMPPF